MVSALIRQARKLPTELYKSLTWDRGKELADELLSKVGDGGFQAARSISFSPSLNLTPSTISARR